LGGKREVNKKGGAARKEYVLGVGAWAGGEAHPRAKTQMVDL